MPTCRRCLKDVGLLGAISFNRQTMRCGKCESEIGKALTRFRQGFLQYTQDSALSDQEWQWLKQGAISDNLEFAEALAYVRGDALHLLDRVLSFAAADGIVTQSEEQHIVSLQNQFGIPHEMARPLLERLGYLRSLSNVRQGQLPTIVASVRLDSDKLCHLETPATYHKVNAKSVTYIQGRLVATSKRLHFLAPTGGAEIQWKSVMRAVYQPDGVYLELSRKSGNGVYSVPDPSMTQAILDTILRVNRRELLAPSEAVVSRHIPKMFASVFGSVTKAAVYNVGRAVPVRG